MLRHTRTFLCFFWLLLALEHGSAQCTFAQPLSQRPANYDISVTLNDQHHTISAIQTIRFTNQSPDAIPQLRFYMYLNAFKNTESTFLKGASNIFGQGFADRQPNEWGWVDISKMECERAGSKVDLTAGMHYVHPDNDDTSDQSVLEVPLDKPLQPGETVTLHLNWQAQMPKTIARAGYSKDFYLFCHWFPQLGVFEQGNNGAWGWNCHQFFRQTEFYADFGVYDVHITTDQKFVLGASGCLQSEKNNENGTITRHYHVEDVIDFAWSAYPGFTVQEARWKDVQIRLLIAPEHADLGPRYIHALQFALEYMDQHVGKYAYPTITVVDPPFHGLRSGLMEYPTLVTVGTFYGMPDGIRTMESLVVHEFVHQYFMGMVASNEKEEPWLDEGFVTYFEDRIIDAAYGQKQSLIDILGVNFDNREQTRLEYTMMANPREGIVGRPAWTFSETNRKALIYSKTATSLRTVQELIGEAQMDQLLKAYFEKWKFRHPRGHDFMAVLKTELNKQPDTLLAQQVYGLFQKGIYEAIVLDYAVTKISNEALFAQQGMFGEHATVFNYSDGSGEKPMMARVEVQRKGDWAFPVDVLVTFEDGSTQLMHWSGQEGSHVFEFPGSKKVVSAQIDPEHKIGLDLDLNNNSMTLQPQTTPLWKYVSKSIFWVQQCMQVVSFLS